MIVNIKGVKYIIWEKYEFIKTLREENIRNNKKRMEKKVILINKGANFKEKGTDKKDR